VNYKLQLTTDGVNAVLQLKNYNQISSEKSAVDNDMIKLVQEFATAMCYYGTHRNLHQRLVEELWIEVYSSYLAEKPKAEMKWNLA
jgi:aspartate carbamoyltransferase regulatory subunit